MASCKYCGEKSFTEIRENKIVCDSCGSGFKLSSKSPSQTAKHHGCKSLAEVARLTKQSEQTLFNWYKNKPELFEVVCIGAGQLAKQKQPG